MNSLNLAIWKLRLNHLTHSKWTKIACLCAFNIADLVNCLFLQSTISFPCWGKAEAAKVGLSLHFVQDCPERVLIKFAYTVYTSSYWFRKTAVRRSWTWSVLCSFMCSRRWIYGPCQTRNQVYDSTRRGWLWGFWDGYLIGQTELLTWSFSRQGAACWWDRTFGNWVSCW